MGARIRFLTLVAVVASPGTLGAQPVTYVEFGSSWRYLPGLAEASSPTGAWRARGFADTAWSTGLAPFGYGEAAIVTDLSAFSPPMEDNYATVFLRREFNVPDATAVSTLDLAIDYDDGFVAWINGVEVERQNAPAGEPAFDDLAPANHESGAVETYSLPDPSGYLEDGTNVLAVQVFNTSRGSSDCLFDCALSDPTGPDLFPPQLSALVPGPGATVRSLPQAEVTFDEEVAGVDAADLRISGSPATSVTGSGAGPYVFTFPEPPPGTVVFTWRAGHGISDLEEPPNTFGGDGWSVTLDPDAPEGEIVITELLALNRDGRLDADGEPSDWFEVYNAGTSAVSLAGWSASDDEEDPGKWVFPPVTLDPGEYLVVFASGKDRRPAGGGELHASFQLAGEGEFLGIYSADAPRRLVSGYAPRYPQQRVDVSYGTAGGLRSYFEVPTPGGPNSLATAVAGFVEEPRISPPRGVYDGALEITIVTRTPDATIYYTLDGSVPEPSGGARYEEPFTISGSPQRGAVPVRAAAYHADRLPSSVATHTFVFPEAIIEQSAAPSGFPSTWGTSGQPADYQVDPRVIDADRRRALDGLVDLPTLSIVTEQDFLFGRTNGIFSNPSQSGVDWERETSAELIHADGRDGFQIDCGVRIQGGSSTSGWKSIKNSARLLFKSDYGPSKLRFPLFEGYPVESFDSIVLDAHLNLAWTHPDHGQRVRSQYVRDQYVSDLIVASGNPSPRAFWVNLYLNGLFWGMYDLHERPDATFSAENFGGEKEEYDVFRHDGGQLVSGSSSAWNVMMNLARGDIANNATYNQLRDYLDVKNLADYMIFNIFAGNDDWPRHNWYASRRRAADGRFRFYSWDAEHVLKSTSINQVNANDPNSPAELWSLLRANDELRVLAGDRVHRHFFAGGTLFVDPSNPGWDPDHPERNVPAAHYEKRIAEIYSAIALESARWGDARRATPYTAEVEWTAELEWLREQYFPGRSQTVLGQFRSAGLYPTVGAPVYSQHGGTVERGFSLVITLPSGTAGTIYYTLDGSDPRTPVSGGVAGSARSYSSPLSISSYTVVKSRIRTNSGAWSALAEATFALPAAFDDLRVSEIHYNPLGGGELEFLELKNVGNDEIDLSRVRFTTGIDVVIDDGVVLGPEDLAVLVSNAEQFAIQHPGVPVAGVFSGRLDNEGERISAVGSGGEKILDLRYDDEDFWPLGADGFGFSLTLSDPDGDPSSPWSWRASNDWHGTPGADEGPSVANAGVIVNEVLAWGESPFEDAVELFNASAAPVDIGGWYLTTDRQDYNTLQRFRIPSPTVIPAGGYVVFYEDEFFAAARMTLPARGGGVYLASASGPLDFTGHIVGLEYPGTTAGVAVGRVETTADSDVAALELPSFGVAEPASVEEFRLGRGAANGSPALGTVVINEIHYHPGPGEFEFVELFNRGVEPMPLFDQTLGAGWEIGGVSNADDSGPFAFRAADAVPGRGYLLVVPIDPVVFREIHAIPGQVPIAGPYGGALDNDGERLRLTRPVAAEGGGVLEASEDTVRFSDRAPWAADADGLGESLERRGPAAYGNEPGNWGASLVAGGTPGAPNSIASDGNEPPVAVLALDRDAGPAPLTVELDGSASADADGSIVAWRWTFGDGAQGEGAIITHVFTARGSYTVRLTVEDDDGAVATASRLVVVLEPSAGGLQRPSDANQDGNLDISDGIALLNLLFLGGTSAPCDGNVQSGGNLTLLNANGDATVDLSDVVYALNFLFLGGPEPVLGAACVEISGCATSCAP